MEEVIGNRIGKKVDVICGASAVFRGEGIGYSNGVLILKDETGRTVYIDGAKVLAISEVTDGGSRPGFIG